MSPTCTCSDRAPYAVYKLVMISDPEPVFVRRKASALGWCQKVPTQENLGERNCQQDEGIAGDGYGNISHHRHSNALQFLDQFPLKGLLATRHPMVTFVIIIIAGYVRPAVGRGGCRVLNVNVGLNVGPQSLHANWEHFELFNKRREGLAEEAVLLPVIIIIFAIGGVGGEEPMPILLLLKCWW